MVQCDGGVPEKSDAETDWQGIADEKKEDKSAPMPHDGLQKRRELRIWDFRPTCTRFQDTRVAVQDTRIRKIISEV